MTDALIEKVARAEKEAVNNHKGIFTLKEINDIRRRAAILAVLDHFSEPGNVTLAMKLSCPINCHDDSYCLTIASAMRAARDEVSRD